MKNLFFRIKEGWKMFTGQYRIEPLNYSKTLLKYSDILVRRRRSPEGKKVTKLLKVILEFNRLVEEVNY
jgi:hypothetical protein